MKILISSQRSSYLKVKELVKNILAKMSSYHLPNRWRSTFLIVSGIVLFNTQTAIALQESPCVNEPQTLGQTVQLPTGVVGRQYPPRFLVAGGKPPYKFKYEVGTLAKIGLSIDHMGFLIGVPVSPGTFEFALEIQDSGACSARQTYKIRILPSSIHGN